MKAGKYITDGPGHVPGENVQNPVKREPAGGEGPLMEEQ